MLVFAGPRTLTALADAERVTSGDHEPARRLPSEREGARAAAIPDVNDARAIRIEATARGKHAGSWSAGVSEPPRPVSRRLLSEACRAIEDAGRCAPLRRPPRERQPPHASESRPVARSGWVGILTCELHFPEAHSLKEKRMLLRSAKAQLECLVGASVAEVDHHECARQRARITAACVTREYGEAERLLDEAERWLRAQEWEVGLLDRFLVDPED